jgi:hypothetical protein
MNTRILMGIVIVLVLVLGTYLLLPREADAPSNGTTQYEEIAWSEAVALIEGCEVTMAFQTHALDVYLETKDGRDVHAVEPSIDDIFAVINATRDECGTFPIATE